MKIICTTSDRYLHILPIFCYLFNEYWSDQQQVEIVGYNSPTTPLPSNFSFVSLGKQSEDKQNFTRDLRKYFAKQDEFFIWIMEDTFLRAPVNLDLLNTLKTLTTIPKVGRINLTKETIRQEHIPFDHDTLKNIYQNTKLSLYRLSTQPSIWNRDFVLKYMQQDLSPWQFELQRDHDDDDFLILGADENAIYHNEGVRKHDVYNYNLDGVDERVINEMKRLKFL